MTQNNVGVYASQISGHLWSPEGAYDSLASVTLSGAVASVSFRGIPSGYRHLQIRAIIRANPAASIDAIKINFNSDSNSNYMRHALYGDGTTAASIASATSTTYASFGDAPGATAGSNIYGAYIVDILDYANTSKYKTTRAISGYEFNGSGEINLRSNLWMSTPAITSMTFSTSSGSNISSNSSFALYGVK